MISLILLKLFTFSQILQGVPKRSHATLYCLLFNGVKLTIKHLNEAILWKIGAFFTVS